MSVLTLSYRPHRFAEVVGQSHIRAVLQAMVKADDIVPALIFAGSRGTGKTTSARILAAALNCEDQAGGDACGSCAQCVAVQKTGAESVLEVDAASNGGVEEVAAIREMCLYSHSGRWRVVLLDEAHSMSAKAFNALLKILEEPPERTIFVLITTEADKILETVRSRAMTFEFRRISEEDIRSRLQHIAEAEGIEASDDLIERIAADVQGGMRDAVMLLDQCHRASVTTATGYDQLLGIRSVAYPLLISAIEGDLATGHSLIEDHFRRAGDASKLVSELTQLVVRSLVVRAGGEAQGSAQRQSEYETVAQRLDVNRMTQVVKLLWDLSERTRSAKNDQRATMDLAYVILSEHLSVKKDTPQRVPQQASEPLSMQALRSMVG